MCTFVTLKEAGFEVVLISWPSPCSPNIQIYLHIFTFVLMWIYLFLFSDFVSLEEYNTLQKTWKNILMSLIFLISFPKMSILGFRACREIYFIFCVNLEWREKCRDVKRVIKFGRTWCRTSLGSNISLNGNCYILLLGRGGHCLIRRMVMTLFRLKSWIRRWETNAWLCRLEPAPPRVIIHAG